MQRSQERITKSDLKKLLRLASQDMESFFERNPIYKKQYRGKEVLVALCQGAALHYIDKKNGVKDFDVWFFYPRKNLKLPYRRRGIVDFGKSKFGKHPKMTNYVGRSIDVLMRSNPAFNSGHPEKGIVSYLSIPKSKSAKLLSQKPVIGLYPESVFGKILWPKNL